MVVVMTANEYTRPDGKRRSPECTRYLDSGRGLYLCSSCRWVGMQVKAGSNVVLREYESVSDTATERPVPTAVAGGRRSSRRSENG